MGSNTGSEIRHSRDTVAFGGHRALLYCLLLTPSIHSSIHPFPPLRSLLPHTPVMCRYTLGWLLFHDRLLLPGAERHLIVNIWAITIAN